MTKKLAHLIVLFCDEEVVKRFIDGLVVVVLHRAQIGLNQWQLFHLGKNITSLCPIQ